MGKNATKDEKFVFIAFPLDIGHDNVGATLAVARIVTGRGKPYPYDRRINVKGKCYNEFVQQTQNI